MEGFAVFSIKRALCLSIATIAMSSATSLAATPTEITGAIQKAKILPAATEVTAEQKGSEIQISTFRDTRANPNDCKIEAIMIARTVLQTSPDTARVSVYFWGKDRQKFTRVAIGAGDIKAFASGQTGKEELLKSLLAEEGDKSGAITRVLESGGQGGPAVKLSPKEIKAIIDKAGVLAPGTAVVANVSGTDVGISTYRNVKANPNDMKIEAILLAKTIMDAAPEATRVHTFFWGENTDKHNKVTISAGNVKAFAAGQTSKEDLLNSIELQIVTSDSATKLANSIGDISANPLQNMRIAPSKDPSIIVVDAQLPGWVPDRDAKFEAIRIAERVLSAADPSAVRSVKIAFMNPQDRSTRTVNIDAASVKQLAATLQSALDPIALEKGAGGADAFSYEVVEGILKEERQAMLNRLRELQNKGVGIGPFLKAFIDMVENHVRESDYNGLKNSIASLSGNLDEQEKRAREAKEAKPKAAPVAKVPDTGGHGRTSRWAPQTTALMDGDILRDPGGVARAYALGPNAAAVYDRIADVLRRNNRADEAGAFQAQAEQARSRGQR